MTTDRELLERAAAASGKDLTDYIWVDTPFYTGFQSRNFDEKGWDILVFDWNPLVDGDDALRLAVSTGLTVQVCNLFNVTIVDKKNTSVRVDHGGKPHDATLRAIVIGAGL